MRLLLSLILAAGSSLVQAQITPEELTVETMGEPGTNWFISKTGNGAYIFDAENGEMQGLLSLLPVIPRQ